MVRDLVGVSQEDRSPGSRIYLQAASSPLWGEIHPRDEKRTVLNGEDCKIAGVADNKIVPEASAPGTIRVSRTQAARPAESRAHWG